jgi:membrane protease YdiL (CAAX protease family)
MQLNSEQPKTSQRKTVFALCGLAGALIFGLLPISHWLVPGDSIAEMLAREAIWWCFALVILLWLTLAERLPISSIGFRSPTWKTVAFAILAATVVMAIMVLQFAVLIPLFHLDPSAAIAGRQAILKTPYWYRVLLVLRAAVVEEILFRGYLIEKVRQLNGSTELAVILSVAAFTCAHLHGWGTVHLIAAGASGVVFALLYVWWRDLQSNMFGHFLSDAVGFLTG